MNTTIDEDEIKLENLKTPKKKEEKEEKEEKINGEGKEQEKKKEEKKNEKRGTHEDIGENQRSEMKSNKKEKKTILKLTTENIEEHLKNIKTIDEFKTTVKQTLSFQNIPIFIQIMKYFEQVEETSEVEQIQVKCKEYFIYKKLPELMKLCLAQVNTKNIKEEVFNQLESLAEEAIRIYLMQEAHYVLAAYSSKKETESTKTKTENKDKEEEEEEEQMTIEQKLKSIMENLIEIIDPKKPFYRNAKYAENAELKGKDMKKYPKKQGEGNYDENYSTFVFASPQKSSKTQSSYYVQNINIFGRLGGCKIVKEAMKVPNAPTWLIGTCWEMVNLMSIGMKRKVIKNICEYLFKYTRNYLETIGDSVLKKEKNMKGFENILAQFSEHVNYGIFYKPMAIDVLELSFILGLAKSSIVEYRLASLKYLIQHIEIVDSENFVQVGYKQGMETRQPLPSHSIKLSESCQIEMGESNLNLHFIRQWIKDKQYLSIIYKKGIHKGVMKASKHLMKFMLLHKALKQHYIHEIWLSTFSTHEASQRIVHDTLICVMPYYQTEHINYLFNEIAIMKLNEIKKSHIDFLQTFLVESTILFPKHPVSNKILTFLFKLTNNHPSILHETRMRAIESLITIIKVSRDKQPLQKLHPRFVQFCTEQVKTLNAYQGLRLLAALLESYSTSAKKKKHSRAGFIEQIQLSLKISIKKLLFSVLKMHNNLQFQLTPLLKYNNDNEDMLVNEFIKENFIKRESSAFSHSEMIDQFFKTLSLTLQHSELNLSAEECQFLWNMLYTKGRHDIEKNMVISWFEMTQAIAESSIIDPSIVKFSMIEQDQARIFYQKCLLKLPIDESFSLALFQLIITFFLSVNIKLGKIILLKESKPIDSQVDLVEEEKPKSVFKSLFKKVSNSKDLTRILNVVKGYAIVQNDLLGIQYLWDIVLSVPDEDVAKKAIHYFNDLRNSYGSTVVEKIADWRKAYVEKVMQEFNLCEVGLKQNIDVIESERKAVRCLKLLLDYVQLFAHHNGVEGHGISSKGNTIKLNISVVDGSSHSISVQKQDSINNLIQYISKKIRVPSHMFCVYASGQDISQFYKSYVKDVNFESEQTLTVKINTLHDKGMSHIKFSLNLLGLNDLSNVLHKQYTVNLTERLNKKSPASEFLPSENNNDIKKDELHIEFCYGKEETPISLLSEPNHFSKLFSSLTLNNSVAESIWVLLLHIPTNQLAKNQLVTLMDMNNIFPKTAIHKLLYNLQIIESFIKEPVAEEQATPKKKVILGPYTPDAKLSKKENIKKIFDKSMWKYEFLEKGGIKQLLQLFDQDYKFDAAHDPLWREAYSLILKLFNTMLSIVQEKDKALYQEMIDKSFNLVHFILTPSTYQFSKKNTSDKKSVREGLNSHMKQELNIRHVSIFDDVSVSNRAMVHEIFKMVSKIDDESLEECKKKLILLVETGLFQFKNEAIRDQIAKEIHGLVNESSSYVKYLAPLFLNHFDTIDPSFTKEYFQALNSLVAADASWVSSDIAKLLLSKLIIHQASEERMDSETDQQLVGYISTLSSLYAQLPQEEKKEMDINFKLIELFFKELLFGVGKQTSTFPKCKTNESRSAGFELLQAFRKNSPTIQQNVLRLVNDYISDIKAPKLWNFNPVKQARSALNYVGLTNLGATCYMNALVQQLFMTEMFRNDLLHVEINPEVGEDHALVYELQRIFAHLDSSSRQCYHTLDFCKKYRNWDGTLMNVSEQQDAHEFFNLFFDKMENVLRSYDEIDLLKGVYGGFLVNQFEYQDDAGKNYVKQIREPFYLLSLDIKNQSSLEDSLSLYMEPEPLQGDNKYYSDVLGKKVDAQRRYLLKSLPNVMIFHLKRFEYNFSNMTNKKLYDRISFPSLLNMAPYMVEEEKDNQITNYVLVGVLIHDGSANAGHYFSYIRDQHEDDQWYEFNDRTIRHFDFNDLDKKCFGGYDEITHQVKGKQTTRSKLTRSFSAYMLFYQREDLVTTKKITDKKGSRLNENTPKFTVKQPPSTNDLKQIIDEQFKQMEAEQQVKPKKELSKIVKQVYSDNETFSYQKNVFDIEFDNFIWRLVKDHQEESKDLYELVYTYLFNISCHAYHCTSTSKKWFTYFEERVQDDIVLAKWLFKKIFNDETMIQKYFYDCYIHHLRTKVVSLLKVCLTVISREQFEDEIEESLDAELDMTPPSQIEIDSNDALSTPYVTMSTPLKEESFVDETPVKHDSNSVEEETNEKEQIEDTTPSMEQSKETTINDDEENHEFGTLFNKSVIQIFTFLENSVSKNRYLADTFLELLHHICKMGETHRHWLITEHNALSSIIDICNSLTNWHIKESKKSSNQLSTMHHRAVIHAIQKGTDILQLLFCSCQTKDMKKHNLFSPTFVDYHLGFPPTRSLLVLPLSQISKLFRIPDFSNLLFHQEKSESLSLIMQHAIYMDITSSTHLVGHIMNGYSTIRVTDLYMYGHFVFEIFEAMFLIEDSIADKRCELIIQQILNSLTKGKRFQYLDNHVYLLFDRIFQFSNMVFDTSSENNCVGAALRVHQALKSNYSEICTVASFHHIIVNRNETNNQDEIRKYIIKFEKKESSTQNATKVSSPSNSSLGSSTSSRSVTSVGKAVLSDFLKAVPGLG